MKKTLLVALALIGFGVATSQADVAFSVSFGSHYRPHYYAPAPVVVAPAPVVVAPPVYRHCPPPVVVAQPVAPVYAPVYAAPVAPVYAAPVYPVYSHHRAYGYGYARPGYCGPGYGRSHGSIRIGW